MPALAHAGPDCDPRCGPLKVIVRDLCVVSQCVVLKITNARMPQERGARVREIGPIGLRQALFVTGVHKLPSSPQRNFLSLLSFINLRSNYFPQDSVIVHPRSMPYSETQFHTHTKRKLLKVLFEKLIVPQLVKKLTDIYNIWTFIAVFIRTRHWSLYKAR